MTKVTIRVKRLQNFKGDLPQYQTELSSGFDVRAQMESALILLPMQRCLVPTGLSFELPPGYEIQARPRSGWALKHGVTLLNTPGTIDADYRGEVKIIVINLGDQPVEIKDQERVAQLVLCEVPQARFEEVGELGSSGRGSGGFGSTGRD